MWKRVVELLKRLVESKRPEGCTCEHYNWFSHGPVDNCPAHRHFLEG